MGSPPTRNRDNGTGGTTSAAATSQTQRLLSDAHLIMANCGVEMTPSKVSRIVRQFEHQAERNGFTFFDFLANKIELTEQQHRQALANSDIARVISYADPTGETAVANLVRGGVR